jgi:hypothetical protein
MMTRGFSLVETVIVAGLSSAMMVALGCLIYNFNITSSYQKTFMQSSNSASTIMREVASLTIPASAVLQTRTFSGTPRSSSSTVLVLEIPSIDSSRNVIANTYDYVVFYVVGTNAYRLIEKNVLSTRLSGTKQLSSTVKSLTFTYNDADFTKVTTVTVDIQTQAQSKGETIPDRRSEQFRLRNH